MFLRIDKLQIELPATQGPDPNAAAALQELLGGKYGEMSTLGNYMFQSFNFRSKDKLKPVLQSCGADHGRGAGHVELVSNGVAMLNNGPDKQRATGDGGDISKSPFEDMNDIRLAARFLSNGGGATPINSNGVSWNTDFVTTTGNVIFDLLHNFHLECGARLHKLRVYETLSDPTGREVCGYLLVRGSVHAHAYALALRRSLASTSRRCCRRPISRWTISRNARSIWTRARIAGSTPSARSTTRKCRASGAMARVASGRSAG